MTEKEDFIILQLKQGSEAGYKYLFEEYYVKLCRVSKMYVGDAFAAENIVSDLFFYLWEHRKDLEIKTTISSYLYASVKNRSLNYLQQASVQREVSFDNIAINASEQIKLASDETPAKQLITKELEDKINKSIDSLSSECRSVFCLSRNESMSYNEISSQLNISINTVRYHIKNALFRLRVDLKEYLTIIAFTFLFQL